MLLDLNPVASMHFARHPSNDCGGRSHLNINNHDFTHDLARHQRTMSFDFARGDRAIPIATFSVHDRCLGFRSVRLVSNATTTKTIALKTARTIARHLFVIEASDVPGAKRTVNG